MILVLTLIGFLGFAGIQRMVVDQVGMGIVYLLTLGLCFVGTIIDLINYQKMSFEYNRRMADEVIMML